MRVLISAGEASGEMYGAQLIEALRKEASRATGQMPAAGPAQMEFFGVGGEKMRAAGCDLVIDAKELSVVGITETLSHLPKIWRLFHNLISAAERRRPDLAIVIDSPAFNWRVAREMKRRGVPVVYYVCPQFWAWRQGRVRYLRRYIDKALVIFPFEEKFYRDRGVDAEFVGHPLAQLPRPEISRQQYAAQQALDIAKPWITIMPGSRRKEVRMNLPEMLRAASRLGHEYEFLLPVAPNLEEGFVKQIVAAHLANAAHGEQPPGARARTHTGPVSQCNAQIHLVPDALPALAHSRAAIVASGTATVEAALMGTPFVMVYRVTPLTYALGRWTVKVPHFAMVNLIAGEQIVPELVQKDFTAQKVVSELRQVLVDGAPRQKIIAGLQRVKLLLQSAQSAESAPEAAAKIILDLVRQRAGSGQEGMSRLPASTSAS